MLICQHINISTYRHIDTNPWRASAARRARPAARSSTAACAVGSWMATCRRRTHGICWTSCERITSCAWHRASPALQTSWPKPDDRLRPSRSRTFGRRTSTMPSRMTASRSATSTPCSAMLPSSFALKASMWRSCSGTSKAKPRRSGAFCCPVHGTVYLANLSQPYPKRPLFAGFTGVVGATRRYSTY